MEKEVMKILFEQLWLHSDNCNCPIEHAWFPIQEAAKTTGKRRSEILQHFLRLIELNIIEKLSDEPLLYQFTSLGKSIKSDEQIESFFLTESHFQLRDLKE